MSKLTGKRVLITGGSSGIGAAAAEAFADQGCEVAVLARSRRGLQPVVKRVRAAGVPGHAIVADLSDRDATDAAIEQAVEKLGGLDLLVLNAASMAFGRFWEIDADTFDQT